MANAYYTVIKEDNNRPYPHYEFEIKWNVDNIAGYKNANGFIVQRVKFSSTIAELHLEKRPYYEAWEVKNGICVSPTDNINYDDKFGLDCINYDDDIVGDLIKCCIGKTGKISCQSCVYWVDFESELYSEVKKWKACTVSMAKNLKSIYEDDCSNFKEQTPIYIRPDFIHNIDLTNDDIIIKSINDIHINRPHSNATLKEFAEYLLSNYPYKHLLNSF